MPTKSRKLYLTPRIFSQRTQVNGQSLSESTTRTYGPYTQAVTYGSNVVGYKQLIKLGLSATTSLTGKLLRIKNPGYFSAIYSNPTATFPTWTKEGSAYGFVTAVAPPASTSDVVISANELIRAENDAKLAFVRKAKAVNRAFQGGVFLGELTEAIRMVKRPANALQGGLGDYLNRLKRARSGLRGPAAARPATLHRIARESWLEYSFGWSPLIKDIETGAEAIAKARFEVDRPKTVFCSGVGQANASDVSEVQMFDAPPILTAGYGQRTIKRDFKVRFYGAVRAYNPANVPFRHYGVNLAEFIPTAWELVPWSFLVDYFANIGDVLECATLIRSDVSWVNRSIKDTVKVSAVYTRFTPTQTGGRLSVTGARPEFIYEEKTRVAWTGSLVPMLVTKVPITGRKLANIYALLPTLRRLTPFR